MIDDLYIDPSSVWREPWRAFRKRRSQKGHDLPVCQASRRTWTRTENWEPRSV